MIDIELAQVNPSSIFETPDDVLNEQSLTREQKIDILRRWSYDEREILVAEEENMMPNYNNRESMLEEILKCLLELGDNNDHPHPPTKQG